MLPASYHCMNNVKRNQILDRILEIGLAIVAITAVSAAISVGPLKTADVQAAISVER